MAGTGTYRYKHLYADLHTLLPKSDPIITHGAGLSGYVAVGVFVVFVHYEFY
jgi:hypothetical protein